MLIRIYNELRALFGRDSRIDFQTHDNAICIRVIGVGVVAATSDGQLFLTHDTGSPDADDFYRMDEGDFVLDVLRAAGKNVLSGNRYWVLDAAEEHGVPAALAMVLRGESR